MDEGRCVLILAAPINRRALSLKRIRETSSQRHNLRLPGAVNLTQPDPIRVMSLAWAGLKSMSSLCFDSLLKGVSLPAPLHTLLNHWVSTLYA